MQNQVGLPTPDLLSRAKSSTRFWYGSDLEGELLIPLHPRTTLDRLRSEVDELHAWQGGGLAFGRKPFLGEFKKASFRIRPLSYRRDGSVGFLVGQVEPAEGGTRLLYRFEMPGTFLRLLPVSALGPVILFGWGGYYAAPVYAEGMIAQVGFVLACAVAGLIFAFFLGGLVLHGIRRDRDRLFAFLSSFEQVP